jgi:hypothetical protein
MSPFLHRHLDWSKVGIVGHWMGGTTATLATQMESGILVGVKLDGSTYPRMNADLRPIPVHQPFLICSIQGGSDNLKVWMLILHGSSDIFMPHCPHHSREIARGA